MPADLTFEEALRAISDLAPRGWRMGLDRIQEFVRLAGLEAALGKGTYGKVTPGPQYLQVAGTNGKGTVTAMIQNALIAQGYNTGAFFSPFVFDPRERVQIGGEFLPDHLWASYTSRLLEIGLQMESTVFEGPTEFEVKTAIGLTAWLEAKCEFVALEVGLGGRLDATSVVTPVAGAIVSIGLDHMSILGNTTSKIAYEKAGIIKDKMPVAMGVLDPEARQTVLNVANEHESMVWEMGAEIKAESHSDGVIISTPGTTYPKFKVPNLGHYSLNNSCIALAIMELGGAVRNPEEAVTGIQQTKVPGRNEERFVLGRTWLLDGAHNLPSAIALAEGLKLRKEKRRVLITSILQGHEPESFYPELAPIFDEIIIAPIDFARARDPKELADEIKKAVPSTKPLPTRTTLEAIQAAVEKTTPEDLIVVTGSFYLVGEVGRLLAKLK